MKKLLLFLLLSLPFLVNAQTVQTAGATMQLNKWLGGISAANYFQLPSNSPYGWNTRLDSCGSLTFWKAKDSCIYYNDCKNIFRVLTIRDTNYIKSLVGAGGLQWTDTLGNLATKAYVIAHIGPSIDTIALSNRINQKQNYTDTATYDATKADVNNALVLVMKYTDTASLSNRINLKQNFSDTTTYDATKANLNTAIAGVVKYIDTVSLSNRINLKQNYTDTTTYDATKADLNVAKQLLIKYTDTAAGDTIATMYKVRQALSTFVSVDTTALSNRINLKQNFSDTTTYDATKADLNNAIVPLIKYADTAQGDTIATMYKVRQALSGFVNIDTTSLSNRINLKQNFSDTSTYDATKADLNIAKGFLIKYADTASGDTIATLYRTRQLISAIPTIDTTALSNRINLKQNFADTTTYDATKADLNNAIATVVKYTDTIGLSNRINLRIPYSDTAAELVTKAFQNATLLNYVKYTDTVGMSNRINLRIPYSDTSVDIATIAYGNTHWGTGTTIDTTALSNRINLRIPYTDTSAELVTKAFQNTTLANYQKYTDTIGMSNRINLKQNFADTTTYDATKANLNTAIASVVKYTDTVGMSNRINLKQNFADTTTYDATKANLNTVIATVVKYTDTVGMSNRINIRIPYSDTSVDIATKANLNNAVAFAQSVTGQTLLGRYSASTGVVQSITIGSGLSLNTSTGVLTASGASFSVGDHNLLLTGSVLTTNKAPFVLTDGATITLDANNGFNDTVVLAGNRTLSITNAQAGDYGTIQVVQDGTGGRILTVPNGTVSLNSAAGATTIIQWYYTGTYYLWADGTVADTRVTFTDNTTGNVSTSAHGFVPKAPNVSTNYLDGTGAFSNVKGTLIGIQVLTSGTTYTPTAGTTSVLLVMVGGGGGGGGVTGTASNVGVGGGGGSGGMLIKYFTSVSGTYTYAIGGTGSGGANTGGTGGTGGNTTFTNGATTYTANGGLGGVGQTASTTAANVLGGAGAPVSTNGDVNGTGAPGGYALRMSGTLGISGQGASSQFGGGGNSLITAAAGNNATGFGSGGGGAMSTAATARVGGTGSGGLIIVYEYR